MNHAVFVKVHHALETILILKEGRQISGRTYLKNLIDEVTDLRGVLEWGVVDGS